MTFPQLKSLEASRGVAISISKSDNNFHNLRKRIPVKDIEFTSYWSNQVIKELKL